MLAAFLLAGAAAPAGRKVAESSVVKPAASPDPEVHHGLRPARFMTQKNGSVCLMSETGVVPGVDDADVVSKGRLGPGDMVTVDLETGELRTNVELKSEIAKRRPYGEWLAKNRKVVADGASG